LLYSYDPFGNIVLTRDLAQEPGAGGAPIRNLAITSEQEFTYDGFMQLERASGRVHRALLEHDYRFGAAGPSRRTRSVSLNDGAAVDRSTRTYEYDPSGNLLRLRHVSTQNWTTDMWVAPDSNRSLGLRDPNGVVVPAPQTRFDACGNVLSLPH